MPHCCIILLSIFRGSEFGESAQNRESFDCSPMVSIKIKVLANINVLIVHQVLIAAEISYLYSFYINLR